MRNQHLTTIYSYGTWYGIARLRCGTIGAFVRGSHRAVAAIRTDGTVDNVCGVPLRVIHTMQEYR